MSADFDVTKTYHFGHLLLDRNKQMKLLRIINGKINGVQYFSKRIKSLTSKKKVKIFKKTCFMNKKR